MTYLAGLNDKQLQAVTTTEGPVSVLAGAGSGKTRVLTTRIYHLIRGGVPAQNILAVTFTNKAAREMRERLSHMLGDSPLPFVATFHGLGREILQTHGGVLGISRYFSVYDRDDSERAVKEALKELGMDPKEVPPRPILSRISKAKGKGQTLDEYKAKNHSSSFQGRVTSDVWEKYEAQLKKEKALDFDDLIVLPVRLLREHPEILERVRNRFQYLHVDEFQDTNELQGEFVEYIAGEKQNLFVVGDIDQNVYSWRGATIENLLSFEKKYPTAQHIVLEHNYRSTKNIVEASNTVIERNKNRKEKHAITDNPEGNLIELHVLDTAEKEARFIALDARSRISDGIPPSEIAVLYRTNFQSRALEEALLRYGVPYTLLGTRFLDRKEVKDVLAWVRLALEPSRDSDRVRAIQSPSRGIGKVTIAKIAVGKQGELTPAVRAKVDAFEAVVSTLHSESETMLPSLFVKRVIELSGIDEALLKDGEEGQERLENARELATLASRYDTLPGRDGIAAFLADTALAGDQDEMDRPESGGKKEGVTLMTVHGAKGLEFEVVYVTGMEEGLFPHQGMGNEEERDEEEERRLFYVAMTRAKKELVLTLARVRRIYGTDFMSEPSSFLSDIDASLLTVEYGDSEEVIHI